MLNASESPKLSIFVPHPSDRLTNCKPDGDGLVAYAFIKHLAQRGHTLHVVVHSVEIEGSLPDNVYLYPANVENAPAALQRLLYVMRVREIFNQIQQRSPIDIIHQLNPVVQGLSLSVPGTKSPVVLGPIVAPWLIKSKTKLPLSRSISRRIKQLAGGSLFRLQQRQAAALLVATPAALARLHNPDAIAKKVYDLRHGIDTKFFSPLSDSNLEHSASPSILFLGQVSEHKGIFTLLDAFEKVAAACPICQLLIAGPWGRQIDQVKGRIEEMTGRSQVQLLGAIQRADVPELIRNCTVYCMPSYGEAFGMGALEAMACGKPVVGTAAGGLQYLISDQGGRKVQIRDADALADALLEILASPELQAEMGQHNRTVAEQIYDWERVTEQLESIYYKVLASGDSQSIAN